MNKTTYKLLAIGIALMAFIGISLAQNPVLSPVVPAQFYTNSVGVYQLWAKYDTNLVPVNGNAAADIQKVFSDIMSVTNFGFYAGGGYALSGTKTYLADAGLIYNVNSYVGLVMGFDWLRMQQNGLKPQDTANVVKGGLQLSYSFPAPYFTNITLTPYGMALVATPTKGTDNNGGIGMINAFGMGETLWHSGEWTFRLVEGMENRSGEGAFNRNYITANAAISYGF